MQRGMWRLMAVAAFAGIGVALVGCADEPKSSAVAVSEVRMPAVEKALAEHKGKVIVVDFWATWCGPCVKKFPHLVEMHKKYADKGLVCMSISMDKAGPSPGTKDEIQKFLGDKGATFPNFILADPDADEKALTARFGEVTAIPFMAIFDRSGKKIWDSDTRRLKPEELEKFVEEQLEKK